MKAGIYETIKANQIIDLLSFQFLIEILPVFGY